jgi:hypothetical protein
MIHTVPLLLGTRNILTTIKQTLSFVLLMYRQNPFEFLKMPMTFDYVIMTWFRQRLGGRQVLRIIRNDFSLSLLVNNLCIL